MSGTQITKILVAAGMKPLADEARFDETTPKNTFRIEGRATLVVRDEAAKNKALKAMKAAGKAFGGFRCGWGGWNLEEGYTISEHARLVSMNCD
jgi:hypothetical protein